MPKQAVSKSSKKNLKPDKKPNPSKPKAVKEQQSTPPAWAIKAIELAEAKLGVGTVRLANDSSVVSTNSFSSGLVSLDIALGIGGIPEGRIIEIYGPESGGKSTLCQTIIAGAQQAGVHCAYLDYEATFEGSWAEKSGVNVDELLISYPNTLEDGLQLIELMVEQAGVKLIVLDSLAVTETVAAAAKDYDQAETRATRANVLSQKLPRIIKLLPKHNATLIIINQVRDNMDMYSGQKYSTPGGRTLKHAYSIRIEVSKQGKTKGSIFKKDIPIGWKSTVKVVKNKLGPAHREFELTLYYTSGFDRVTSLIDAAVEFGVIESGSNKWFSYPDKTTGEVHKFQGEKFNSFLEENPGLQMAIADEVRQAHKETITILQSPSIEDWATVLADLDDGVIPSTSAAAKYLNSLADLHGFDPDDYSTWFDLAVTLGIVEDGEELNEEAEDDLSWIKISSLRTSAKKLDKGTLDESSEEASLILDAAAAVGVDPNSVPSWAELVALIDDEL